MPSVIRDGAGSGVNAKVSPDGRLHVVSKSAPTQHTRAHENEEAFQVQGVATLASGTVVVLHIKNTDPVNDLVITYIRHQVLDPAGGTAFPNASNYCRAAYGRTYTSGGSAATPVNTTSGSGVTALATCYQGAPTLGGNAAELDRWYTQSEGDMNVWSKDGSFIVPPGQTFEVAYVGDQSSGTVWARVSFYFDVKDG